MRFGLEGFVTAFIYSLALICCSLLGIFVSLTRFLFGLSAMSRSC